MEWHRKEYKGWGIAKRVGSRIRRGLCIDVVTAIFGRAQRLGRCFGVGNSSRKRSMRPSSLRPTAFMDESRPNLSLTAQSQPPNTATIGFRARCCADAIFASGPNIASIVWALGLACNSILLGSQSLWMSGRSCLFRNCSTQSTSSGQSSIIDPRSRHFKSLHCLL
jgi:hypothetical protein